jgi:competence protein ComEC
MLREKIDAAFAPRSAGLFSGILFGDTSSMPLSVATDFRRTGTTHIVALSGFNVTIILQALVTLGLPLVGKRWTTVLGLGMVVVFVIATGASSSVVRAAVMAIILQGIRLVGRPVHPDRVVAFSVVLMSLQNPWLLWHDLGFQLSMSSTFGLLRLRPALERFGRWIPTVWELRDNFISTVAASLASAPILLATFGGWSLISFPANVVVLPAIPMIMGLGTLSLPALLLPQSLQHLALAPVDALMRGVLRSLQLFSSIPWAYQQIPTWGILLSILLTIFGIAAAYAYSERYPR